MSSPGYENITKHVDVRVYTPINTKQCVYIVFICLLGSFVFVFWYISQAFSSLLSLETFLSNESRYFPIVTLP